ncbi:MAG: general stress protein [Gammaproteobacteria bacterium]|nr:general stress protein [Gammaproteobacteria bacterium]
MSQERPDTPHRGFASMDPQRQRQIASKGGQSVPDEKRSFSQNRRLAAEAGRKGGQASHRRVRARLAVAQRSGPGATAEPIAPASASAPKKEGA